MDVAATFVTERHEFFHNLGEVGGVRRSKRVEILDAGGVPEARNASLHAVVVERRPIGLVVS